MLDLFSKNFFGIFLTYLIFTNRNKKNTPNSCSAKEYEEVSMGI
jgi:hypothetical protein